MNFHGGPKLWNIEVTRSPLYQGFFGRMFRTLPPAIPSSVNETEQRKRFEDLAASMLETIEQTRDNALDNKKIPAGYTYFGQFVDHDITFDTTSRLDRLNDPERLVNFRTPRFDLDSLYGRGPTDTPFMYDQGHRSADGGAYFLLTGKGANPKEDDLLRNEQGVAIIGDPRNDENIIVSQLQLVFIKFHNRVMEILEADNAAGGADNFAEAQRIVRWHYQWVVVHDFLERIVSKDLLKRVLPDPQQPEKPQLRFYHPKNAPFMPVEFSAAAYRLGHSMVRSAYTLSDKLTKLRNSSNIPGITGRIPIFLPRAEHQNDGLDNLRDLRAGLTKASASAEERKLPAQWTIQWDQYFEMGGSAPQLSRHIDTRLALRLGAIPAGPGGENALALLNLIRGWRLQLPSGQDVARAMGVAPHQPNRQDPLWLYILEEAERGGGEQLGEVGGTIVAEVFLGLLAEDRNSYLRNEPTWSPQHEKVLQIPAEDMGHFQLRDIIRFSGAAVTDADIPAIE